MSFFDDAIDFAVKAHEGQTRKLDEKPYILHPMEAATIASSLTDDMEVLCAALLHDTLEDSACTLKELAGAFGERVASLVLSETEQKYPDEPKEKTWVRRKAESLEKLKNSEDTGVPVVWLSDKLSNMRSFYRDYQKKGLRVFEGLNMPDPAWHAWYYREILSALRPRLGREPAFLELEYLVDTVFRDVKALSEEEITRAREMESEM